MLLTELIHGAALTLCRGHDLLVSNIADDSRAVTSGSVFIARDGAAHDAAAYIRNALDRGAAAIIAPDRVDPASFLSPHSPVAWVSGPEVTTGLTNALAERFYGYPSSKLHLIGITGTNGKTTTAYVVRHLLQSAGMRCGLIGTIEIDDGANCDVAELTTPGPVAVSALLARMVRHGCRAAVMEVSSHALAQGRTAGLTFRTGVFTNLTGDHLDFHKTMDAYATAKARLFAQLGPHGWAIINSEDPYAERMEDAFLGGGGMPQRLLHCRVGGSERGGRGERTAASATVLGLGAAGSRARFDGPWGSVEVDVPLVGRHNLSNVLHAMAAAQTVTPLERSLRRSLYHCPPVPGRLEPVRVTRHGRDLPTVLVDYAHTHDALENVLLALRPVTTGRLIVVFGAGGDRDRSKRPKMASVACRLADSVVVTSDNPRTEAPESIIAEILTGVPGGPAALRVQVEPDRAAAIARAIGEAAAGDVVLIAGKGHEDYQIIGHAKRHFDDREEARQVLEARADEAEASQIRLGRGRHTASRG